MTLSLIPFKSVGGFQLESNVKLFDLQLFDKSICDDKTEWDKYTAHELGIILYTEEDVIVSIACNKECFLRGKNIIKMKIGEFVHYNSVFPDLNQTDLIFLGDEDYPHIVYEFDNLGLQVWVKGNIIETVYCSPFIEEDSR